MLGFDSVMCNEVYKMEKERVTQKRKSAKKSYAKFEKDLDEVKEIVKKVDTPIVKTSKKCKRCEAEMNLVKTRGLLKIYKCPNCSFTTEEWV